MPGGLGDALYGIVHGPAGEFELGAFLFAYLQGVARQLDLVAVQVAQRRLAVGCEQLGGVAGRAGPLVGGQLGEANIYLVANGYQRWNAAAGHRARYRFGAEGL